MRTSFACVGWVMFHVEFTSDSHTRTNEFGNLAAAMQAMADFCTDTAINAVHVWQGEPNKPDSTLLAVFLRNGISHIED